MTELTELDTADAYCRFMANRHYENFSVASLALPAATRQHLARIYAFCRTTDDLGDESGASGLQRLELWRVQVRQCLVEGAAPIHPVLLALSHTVDAFEIPPQPFLDLIEANVQDQHIREYETWDDLRQYCTLSAAPVGRMVLRVFGIRDPRAESLSDDVCIGLQLANFAQDVRVDRVKGRTYLLQSDLRSGNVADAVRALCDRATDMLASGLQLEEMAPLSLRVQLALYRLGGLAIITAIRRMEYRTDEKRPQVSAREKVRLVPLAVLQSTRRREHGPAPHLA